MKKVFALISMALVATWSVFAQDTQDAVAEAAAALSAAEDVPEVVEKPSLPTSTSAKAGFPIG